VPPVAEGDGDADEDTEFVEVEALGEPTIESCKQPLRGSALAMLPAINRMLGLNFMPFIKCLSCKRFDLKHQTQ
jgi:hypothetical protein